MGLVPVLISWASMRMLPSSQASVPCRFDPVSSGLMAGEVLISSPWAGACWNVCPYPPAFSWASLSRRGKELAPLPHCKLPGLAALISLGLVHGCFMDKRSNLQGPSQYMSHWWAAVKHCSPFSGGFFIRRPAFWLKNKGWLREHL